MITFKNINLRVLQPAQIDAAVPDRLADDPGVGEAPPERADRRRSGVRGIAPAASHDLVLALTPVAVAEHPLVQLAGR